MPQQEYVPPAFEKREVIEQIVEGESIFVSDAGSK